MPQGESLLAGRGPSVGAADDLEIRPTDADSERFHEHRAVLGRRLGHFGEIDGVLLKGNNGHGAHGFTVVT